MRLREELLYYSLRIIKQCDPRQTNLVALSSKRVQRILLISSTALGDAVLSTPAYRSIRLAYPHARISLLLNVQYISLFAQHPDIDEIIPYHGGYHRFIRLAWQLHRYQFDLACILHGNEPQATPLAYLSGARFIFKLPNTNRFSFLLTNQKPMLTWDDFYHGIDQRLAVAKLAGGLDTDHRMTLPLSQEAKDELATLAAMQGINAHTQVVGFQIGASARSRQWAEGRFIELGRRLLATYPDVVLVLTGSPAEQAQIERVARAISRGRVSRGVDAGFAPCRVWATAGKLPLRLLPALVARCQVLVTGDTGPMHVAVAVNTPVLALFAVSDYRRSGPSYNLNKHTVIQKWRTCDPCLSKQCPYAEPICMQNISVNEVFEGLEKHLLQT